tara:strand:- start:297 stop:557 length:261 start_codon:yes stop_codon:yes gene_type:complete
MGLIPAEVPFQPDEKSKKESFYRGLLHKTPFACDCAAHTSRNNISKVICRDHKVPSSIPLPNRNDLFSLLPEFKIDQMANASNIQG